MTARMSQRQVHAILFDLDGTLVDSAQDITTSVNWTLTQLGLPARRHDEVVTFVGDGMKLLLTRAIGTDDPERLRESLRLFREHYWAHCLETTHLYPEVIPVLDALRTTPLAVVTNKPREVTGRILEGLGIATYFRVVLGGESTAQKKPHPEPLLKALQQLNAEPQQSAIVGDHPNDIQAGHAAGLVTCAVTYGLCDRATLQAEHPHLLLDRLPDLLHHFA